MHGQQEVHPEGVDRRHADSEQQRHRPEKADDPPSGGRETAEREKVRSSQTENGERFRVPRPRVRIHGATLVGRGCSSVGRASAFQAECRRFEPGRPLSQNPLETGLFFHECGFSDIGGVSIVEKQTSFIADPAEDARASTSGHDGALVPRILGVDLQADPCVSVSDDPARVVAGSSRSVASIEAYECRNESSLVTHEVVHVERVDDQKSK